MLGERLETAEVGPHGLEHDRRWVVVDGVSGERIANKHGPTDPRLRACRALVRDGELEVRLPGGAVERGEAVAAALSALLEREVGLAEHDRADGPAQLGRPVAHHDFAAVHLVHAAALAHLGRVAPGVAWDARRFRPNVVLDGAEGEDGLADDRLVGAELRTPGGVALTVAIPTPRCVVPTRAHEGLEAEPELLRTLARHHRIDLGPFGRSPCAGVYAEVATAGTLAVGDAVTVAAADDPAAALASTLAALEASFGAE